MKKASETGCRRVLARRLEMPDGSLSASPVLLTLRGNRLLAREPFTAETPGTTYHPGIARLLPGGTVVFQNQK